MNPPARGNWIAAGIVLIVLTQLAIFRGLILVPGGIIADATRSTSDVAQPGIPRLGNDLTRLFLPHHIWTGREVREAGRIPGWDQRGFGGRPLVGNPQAGVFYPPVWLFWLGGRPTDLCLLIVAHLVLLGCGGVALGRSLGLREGGSLLAGLVLSTHPYFLAQVGEGHYPHVWSVAWLPWCASALIRDRQGDRSAWKRAAGFSALSFLAGHPQEWFYFQTVVGAILLVDLIRSRGRSRRQLVGPARYWLASLGLISAELLPELATRGEVAAVWGTGLTEAGRQAIGPLNLLQLLDPFALGGPFDYRGPGSFWETQLSMGLAALGLALFGIIRSEDGQRSRRTALVLLGCLAFAAGPALGLYTLAATVVPALGAFRCPSRMLFIASIAGSMLAGIGWEAAGSGRYGRVVLIAAATLWAGETLRYASRVIVVSPLSAWIGPDPIGDFVRPGPIRADDSLYDDLSAGVSRVEKTNVADSFQLAASSTLYRRLYRLTDLAADAHRPANRLIDDAALERAARRALDLFSVRFVVVPKETSTLDLPVACEGESRFGGYRVLENPTALPRAYVVPRASGGSDDGWLTFALGADPRTVILLRSDSISSAVRQPFTPADFRATAPDRIEVSVETDAPGYLVVGITWMPGWSATLDGRPVELLRGNVAFGVVPLPRPGNHVVKLRYDPPGLPLGLLLSAGTAAGLLLGGFFAPTIVVGRLGRPWGRRASHESRAGGARV